jgi:hypothetical protein
MSAIPLGDAADFAPAARRTALVRMVLVALVVAALLTAAAIARNPRSQTIVSLPAHADTIVVLDLSASIGSDTYSRIGATLASLARSRARYGLVVFSGQAYEALPPGSPAEDLAPLVRFFVPRKQAQPGFAASYPKNPWTDTFSAGTTISSGLQLAHSIATGDGLHRPAVVLVSDLDDDPADIPRLAAVTLAYRRDGIPLRVVALDPTAQNAAFFQRLLGPATPIVRAGVAAAGQQPRNRTPYPWLLVALGVAGAAALAAYELWAPPLEWEPAL